MKMLSMSRNPKAKFELIPKDESRSFAVREFILPAFTSPWHFHEECELTWIRRGSGQRFVGDSIASFEPGDLVLIGSNLPHYWRNAATARKQADYAHSVVVHFRPDSFGSDFLACAELLSVRRLLDRARGGLAFSRGTLEQVSPLLQALPAGKGLAHLIGFLQILHLLSEDRKPIQLSSPGFSPQLDQFASERINIAYGYIFQHFAGAINYEAIARTVGMSPSAFSHYFRRVTGRTVSDFVNEVRIGHAHRLLLETDQTIAEVAFACGFESLSHFNRRFRILSGVSPSQFLRRHQVA